MTPQTFPLRTDHEAVLLEHGFTQEEIDGLKALGRSPGSPSTILEETSHLIQSLHAGGWEVKRDV